MKLKNLFNIQDLYNEIDNGDISAREYHNKVILNYTPRVTYSGNWNKINTQTRGLIVEAPLSGESNIIARPFAKFFTIEQEQGTYHLCDEEGSFESTFKPNFNANVIAVDKLDGSLGILWDDNGEPALSTRGRLDSEIALSFTNFLRSNSRMYMCAKHMIERFPHKTFLFELLDPEEHVIHYPHRDIVLLGYVDIETGSWTEGCLLNSEWEQNGFSVAQRLNCETLGEALALPERENAEGMVIHFFDGKLIKFKQDSYLALRALRCNWNKGFTAELEKTNFAQWLEYANHHDLKVFGFSDEVMANVEEVKNVVENHLYKIYHMASLWNSALVSYNDRTQKEYALKVLGDPLYSKHKKFLFAARKYGKIDNLCPFNYTDVDY